MKESIYKKIIEKQDELIRFLNNYYAWEYFNPSTESEVIYANYKQEIAELITELENYKGIEDRSHLIQFTDDEN